MKMEGTLMTPSNVFSTSHLYKKNKKIKWNVLGSGHNPLSRITPIFSEVFVDNIFFHRKSS